MPDQKTNEKASEKPNEETFHIAAVAGLMTGFVLGVGDEDGFSAQHKLAEHVLGHPIWTHEFTEEGIWNRIQAELVRQHPILVEMPAYDRYAAKHAKVLGDVMTYVLSYVETVSKACGRTLTFTRGNGERKERYVTVPERFVTSQAAALTHDEGLDDRSLVTWLDLDLFALETASASKPPR